MAVGESRNDAAPAKVDWFASFVSDDMLALDRELLRRGAEGVDRAVDQPHSTAIYASGRGRFRRSGARIERGYAILASERDLRAHDRCLAEAEETAAVLAAARELSDRAPGEVTLLSVAERQHARALRALARSIERLERWPRPHVAAVRSQLSLAS